jgi:hypothetical protein
MNKRFVVKPFLIELDKLFERNRSNRIHNWFAVKPIYLSIDDLYMDDNYMDNIWIYLKSDELQEMLYLWTSFNENRISLCTEMIGS